MFDRREAQRSAWLYRRRGLDPTARVMVGFLAARGIDGATVVEVGGGIGALALELLRAGASRGINVELSPAYEEVARELLEGAGGGDRVERRIGDFVEMARAIGPADVVVMNRVVCCYPDMAELVGAAADGARRWLALSFPRRTLWTRLGIWAANLFFRLRRVEFRTYLHPPSAIVTTARRHGLRPVMEDRRWIWQAVVFERAA